MKLVDNYCKKFEHVLSNNKLRLLFLLNVIL